MLRVHALLHESIVDASIGALREDIGGETEAPLEVGEPGHPPEECVAHDEQTPPLPDHFQGSRSRTVLAFVGTPQHKVIITMVLASCRSEERRVGKELRSRWSR